MYIRFSSCVNGVANFADKLPLIHRVEHCQYRHGARNALLLSTSRVKGDSIVAYRAGLARQNTARPILNTCSRKKQVGAAPMVLHSPTQ